MITAKVVCTQKNVHGEDDNRQATVTFGPDYQDGRNKEWAAATPALNLQMTLRGDVADQFEPGRSYTLTFTEE